MQIAAVLDLMNRVVVRGIAGERESYRPIESRLTIAVSPAAVARALLETFPLEVFYVADLDAIGGGEPNWHAYDELLELVGEVWIDAGVGDAANARRMADYTAPGGRRFDGVIVGLESLVRPSDLATTLVALGAERAIFSLDMQRGRLLTRIDVWRETTPDEMAALAVAAGYRRLIVLDLAGVGTGQGVPTADLCRRLHQRYHEVELISGGGVRHAGDLQQLAEAGCSTALVASALHDGRLTREDFP